MQAEFLSFEELAARRTRAQRLDINGCLRLIGAIVHQAIVDAMKDPSSRDENKQKSINIKEDAHRFLFSEGKLEKFFQKYHVQDHISAGYVRAKARDVVEGRIKIEDISFSNL